MVQVFLTDESFIRGLGGVDENVASTHIYQALQEAQDIKLHQILGTDLLNSLKDKVAAQVTIPEPYKELLNLCQYYLSYQTLAQLPMTVHYKISNAGIQIASDEHLQPASPEELDSVIKDKQEKADWYAGIIQKFLLKHSSQIPELTENDAYAIKANITSQATTGLWLGGVRNPNRCWRGKRVVASIDPIYDK